jgi:hypothetical protein
MSRPTLFRKFSGLGLFLIGILVVNTLPSSAKIECWKLANKQNRFCTYGIGMMPSISRTTCFPTAIDQIVCEKTHSSLNPSFKSSIIVEDPTGSYIGKSNILANSKSKPKPQLVIVNHRRKTQIPIPNYSFKDQYSINLMRDDFDDFLKNPTRKTYKTEEIIPGAWALAIPVGGIFALASIIIFQGKSLKNKKVQIIDESKWKINWKE